MWIDSFTKSIKIWNLLLLCAMLTPIMFSCEERFTPIIDAKYDNLLVVEGRISNLPGPYIIKLSSSGSVDNKEYVPLSGYQVIILDNVGNREILTQPKPGTYTTSPDGIQGIIGRKYKIEITATNGNQYTSDFEELLNPVGIDSVYAEVEFTPIDEFPYNLPGYQFYLDATKAQNDSTYFMWYLEESYQYESDFKIYFSYYDKILHPVSNKDTLKKCWQTEKITGFYLMSTASLSSPEIIHFPLHYVATDNRRLSVRYSVLTEQYIISQKAFNYWKSTTEQNTENGELYTKQLYQIRGNIYNPNDSGESVFGYFLTAGVSHKRVFFNRPVSPVEMYYSKCVLIDNDYEMYGWMFLGPAPPANNPLYVTENAAGARALPGQACLDCRLKGGTLEKPDFWIDY